MSEQEQCTEVYPVPIYDRYKGAWQQPVCQRHAGHDGKHRAHKAYGGVEWETARACLNCGFPKPRCFLCADCWRPAIISPAVVVLVESLIRWVVP